MTELVNAPDVGTITDAMLLPVASADGSTLYKATAAEVKAYAGGGGGGGGYVAFAFSETVVAQSIATSPALVDAMAATFTLEAAGNFFVEWDIHAVNTSGGNGIIKTNANVDGTDYLPGGASYFFYPPVPPENGVMSIRGAIVLNLVAGSHTIEIMGQAALQIFTANLVSRSLRVQAV